ncbi:MAG: hypothetical protein AB1627_15390 [Chloroflexota bacterium]
MTPTQPAVAETAAEIRERLNAARADVEDAEGDELIADAELIAAREARALEDTPANRSRLSKAQKALARAQERAILARAKVSALDRGLEKATDEARREAAARWGAVAAAERAKVGDDERVTLALLGRILEDLDGEEARLTERAREIERLAFAAAADGTGLQGVRPARLFSSDHRLFTNLRGILGDLVSIRQRPH